MNISKGFLAAFILANVSIAASAETDDFNIVVPPGSHKVVLAPCNERDAKQMWRQEGLHVENAATNEVLDFSSDGIYANNADANAPSQKNGIFFVDSDTLYIRNAGSGLFLGVAQDRLQMTRYLEGSLMQRWLKVHELNGYMQLASRHYLASCLAIHEEK